MRTYIYAYSRLLVAILAMITGIGASAQYNIIYDKNIATLQVSAGYDMMNMPVVRLGSHSIKDRICISFDDFTHQYNRYTYKIEHCEADWSVSEQLFESDYIEGFYDGNTIDDLAESLGTYAQYTNYKLTIPNERCSIKMSGNYRLTVYDENDNNRKVLEACFMVVEPLTRVAMSVSSNTDIDINKRHQQVSIGLDYGVLNVTDPAGQIKTTVLQNGCWATAVRNAKAQINTGSGLKWEHCRQLIFPAGNEYHKYEILDVSHPTMGIERIDWDGTTYQVYPFINEPRPNYLYDEDADGAFFIRNSDNIDNDIACEYVTVNYTLKCPQPVNGDVYINGRWTYDRALPEYKMTYDPVERCYRASIRQKQGYYSYRYVMIDASGRWLTMPTEGDYWQTENRYQALIYYKGIGDRADKLVGYGVVMSN